eukprot:CAMPEP_0180500220 /NCGR_PEP_ID=MMETSP1036_2-20121128/44263_1 /TAXON_ID=632150 /ORGANISM="Azadinium spinosum, Strain 3D9" /LENGTH=53 /DNA_ID=CAMNT_0022508927 /DNA_START=154 /DNA_END=311 /DNA_ORIENTATION=-
MILSLPGKPSGIVLSGLQHLFPLLNEQGMALQVAKLNSVACEPRCWPLFSRCL